jgi:FkbM family methyltransferase
MRERAYLQHGVDVRGGDVVFDVGANVGVAAAFFAAECHAGVVHSFEPVAPLYEYLCVNTKPYPACVAHPYGLSDRTRRTAIAYYPTAAAMSSLYADPDADAELVRTCLVNRGATREEAERAVPESYRQEMLQCELRNTSEVIDEVGVEQIDLLKIDVEKAELDVMRGISDAGWPREASCRGGPRRRGETRGDHVAVARPRLRCRRRAGRGHARHERAHGVRHSPMSDRE